MVRQKVVIDTNIIIDHLRQKRNQEFKSQLEKIVANRKVFPLISTATIQELFAGQSSKKTKEERKIRRVLKSFVVITITGEIAERAGKIIRDTKQIIRFADAQIAASAILEKAYLATKNKKDFQNIKDLKFYQDD